MQTEYLLIGQGICGTWLSYFLNKEKRSFLVIDNNQSNSSSRIAAGIINPVTGRRLVTVWLDEEILPFCKHSYDEIGKEINSIVISQKNIIDFFPSLQMMQTFLQRTEEGCKYLHPYPDQNDFRHYFNFDFACGEIDPAYIIHLDVLLPAWRKHLSQNEQLIEDDFDLARVNYFSEKIQYKDIVADKIIFCDGIQSMNNPLFNRLPFAFNKGEMLIIEAPELSSHHIYKKGLLLAPLNNEHIFWAGTNYSWEYNDDLPTNQFRETTERALKQWSKIPFKVVDHKAAIRPANVERRPFVGMHPVQKNAGILNGMGSKGCSLAPYFAKQFVDHLIHKKEILPEADVNRFRKILSH